MENTPKIKKKCQKKTLQLAMGITIATTVQGGVAWATQPMPCALPARSCGVTSVLLALPAHTVSPGAQCRH